MTLAVAALLVSGCRPTAPPDVRGASASAAPVASSVPAAASAAPVPAGSSSARAGEGCFSGALAVDPAARLGELRARCVPGLVELGDVASPPAEAPVPALPKGACVRAVAVGQGTVRASLVVGDRAVAVHEGPGFAVVPPDGPLCPSGEVRVRLEGASRVVLVRTGP